MFPVVASGEPALLTLFLSQQICASTCWVPGDVRAWGLGAHQMGVPRAPQSCSPSGAHRPPGSQEGPWAEARSRVQGSGGAGGGLCVHGHCIGETEAWRRSMSVCELGSRSSRSGRGLWPWVQATVQPWVGEWGQPSPWLSPGRCANGSQAPGASHVRCGRGSREPARGGPLPLCTECRSICNARIPDEDGPIKHV